MKSKRGTTATDLLVVIAILVVLGGMIVGGFGYCKPQSRWRSRITGKDLVLAAPEDLANVRDIVGFSVDGRGRKNLAYISRDGKFRVREYTDWGVFEGGIIMEVHDSNSIKNKERIEK